MMKKRVTLNIEIGYLDIPNIIEKMLDEHEPLKLDSVDKILELDDITRIKTEKVVQKVKSKK